MFNPSLASLLWCRTPTSTCCSVRRSLSFQEHRLSTGSDCLGRGLYIKRILCRGEFIFTITSVAKHQNVFPIFSLTVVSLCILSNPRHGPSPIIVFYHLKSIQSLLANRCLLNLWDIPSQYHFIGEPACTCEGVNIVIISFFVQLLPFASGFSNALFHHIPIHSKFPFMVSSHSW